jgi:hypothetical protein
LEANYATTLSVTTMYFNQGIPTTYRIWFFQTKYRWGYNGCLNHISSSPQHHFLSFQLEDWLPRSHHSHCRPHSSIYTTESFRYRDEVVAAMENNTYHAGEPIARMEERSTQPIRGTELIGLAKLTSSMS